MGWIKRGCLLVASTILLQGCGSLGVFSEDDTVGDYEGRSPHQEAVKQIGDPVAPMVLRVVGYGTINPSSRLSKVQKRLMAMRASRLDAYRNMAERVYGTSIEGNSTVRDLVVLNDQFRTFVDTNIHGARVVATDVMDDDTVETVLEMVIDEGFRNCLTTDHQIRFNTTCRAPVVHDLNAYRENRERKQSAEKKIATKENTDLYFVD